MNLNNSMQIILAFSLYLCLELIVIIGYTIYDRYDLIFTSSYWLGMLMYLILAGLALIGTLILYNIVIYLSNFIPIKPNIYVCLILFSILQYFVEMYLINDGIIEITPRCYEFFTVNLIVAFIPWFRTNLYRAES